MGAFEYQGNPIISPTGTANPSICSGLTTSLSANCIAGTVSWYASDGTTFLQSGSPYGTPNLTSPSSYKVRCEDGGCFSDFVMVNVSIVAPPTVTITGGNVLTCSITSVSRTASGGGSYSWSNALGTNALANITTAGTYTVTVAGTNSCTATASTVVTKINDLIVTASNDGPYNEGDNINLTGTGGSTYSWTGPNGFTSLLTNPTISNATPAHAGIYMLTVNVGSCSGTATTQVNISCSNPGMSYFLAYSGETPEIIALLVENLMVQESIKPMTIIAVANCELPVIESARLQLSGVGNNYFYIDNNQPFALNENSGQLSGEVLVPTFYTFICRGYDQDNAEGNVIIGPDVIGFNIVSGNGTISTPTTNIQSVCGGGSLTVSANQTGSFNVGNVFQAYLSDANGKFGNPTLIGSSANPNTINCTIPNILTSGTNYKIMIRSSAPVVSSLATIANISITSTNVNVNLVSPTNDLLNLTKTEKASASMNATNKIFGSSNVQYKAGNQIVLQPGFSATSGTVFLAKIENVCGN